MSADARSTISSGVPPTLFRTISNLMYGFFGAVVCGTTYLFLVVSLLHFFERGAWRQVAMYAVVLLWATIVHLPVLLMLTVCSMRCAFSSEPIMLTVATHQMRLPRVSQPFAVIWWVAHLLISFAFCCQISPIFIEGRRLPPDAYLVAVVGGACIVSLLCSLAFGFALLAYAVVDNDRERLLWLLRWSWAWGAICGIGFGCYELIVRG